MDPAILKYIPSPATNVNAWSILRSKWGPSGFAERVSAMSKSGRLDVVLHVASAHVLNDLRTAHRDSGLLEFWERFTEEGEQSGVLNACPWVGREVLDPERFRSTVNALYNEWSRNDPVIADRILGTLVRSRWAMTFCAASC